jgi:hypothetical protein
MQFERYAEVPEYVAEIVLGERGLPDHATV